ncbi:MAG: hydrogenase 4 subunit B [Alphaproteobacteria bacterium]|nr:hydrogenase 4 subunit B [Alphaproteobacteria bacterium]
MLTLTLLGLLLLLVLGVSAPFIRPDRLALRLVHGGIGGMGLALGIAAAVRLVAGGDVAELDLPLGLPWMGTHFRLDDLACFFMAAINLAAALIMVFADGYAGRQPEPARALAPLPIFLASCNLVLLANDAFVFLLAWELMSIASWLLVLANHRDGESRRAAYVYLAMASLSVLLLLLAFGALAGAEGDYRFAALREAIERPPMATLAVILAMIGCGSKAGLVPLHVWLPLAHPAAPSHVSALLSGVMVKIAIYGLARFLFDLAGAPVWWWGVVLLVVGALSALIGVLYALMQRDLKRLLAYSTIENVGIIVFALGLSLCFRTNELFDLSALALAAALAHVLNHAFFKSLMFCGAGVILEATNLRDIERMGGLVRRLPYASLFMLIGSLAAAGLPPLNGFVSEWLIFQAVFASSTLHDNLPRLVVPLMAAVLALSAALAAVAFVRAFGLAFLGRPRSEEASRAVEPGGAMLTGLALLAVACLLLGVFPVATLSLAQSAAHGVVGVDLPAGAIGWFFLAPLGANGAAYAGFIVFLVLLGLAIGMRLLLGRIWPERRRRAAAWDCGFPDPSPATQYTASSFSQPLRRVFGATVFGARETVDMPPPGDTRPARLEVRMIDPAWDWGVEPIRRAVENATQRLDATQFLSIRRYLSLMFGALVLLLLIVAATQQ